LSDRDFRLFGSGLRARSEAQRQPYGSKQESDAARGEIQEVKRNRSEREKFPSCARQKQIELFVERDQRKQHKEEDRAHRVYGQINPDESEDGKTISAHDHSA